MSKYRKKPVEIEAWRVPVPALSRDRGHVELTAEIAERLIQDTLGSPRGVYVCLARSGKEGSYGGIEIETLEGTMRAEPGDWIIRGVKGELYPCKPDIFEQTYEAVDREKP